MCHHELVNVRWLYSLNWRCWSCVDGPVFGVSQGPFPMFSANAYLEWTKFKNSSRVFGSSRKTPSMVEVTVLLLIFCTPRITMHMWLWANKQEEHYWNFHAKSCINSRGTSTCTYTPSTTTATPAGCTACVTATAICLVKRSCTWRRREKISTILQWEWEQRICMQWAMSQRRQDFWLFFDLWKFVLGF